MIPNLMFTEKIEKVLGCHNILMIKIAIFMTTDMQKRFTIIQLFVFLLILIGHSIVSHPQKTDQYGLDLKLAFCDNDALITQPVEKGDTAFFHFGEEICYTKTADISTKVSDICILPTHLKSSDNSQLFEKSLSQRKVLCFDFPYQKLSVYIAGLLFRDPPNTKAS